MTQPTGASRGFMKRLSMYLLGVAIGLVMLGLFQRVRQSGAQPAAQPPASATQPPSSPTAAEPQGR